MGHYHLESTPTIRLFPNPQSDGLLGVSLEAGPNDWVHARILDRLFSRFLSTNLRSVLPDGYSAFWNPLVTSLLDRVRPSWDFFPSQIEAIQRGLLLGTQTFALQMPTGSGKTTLCETLLYAHACSYPADASVLIVPYRSLASELRGSLVRHLNKMGISARCAYGGTVPSGNEVQELADTRVVVATPESLSGLLSADPDFFRRISLVICDEGHLLDQRGRGVALELLLARMKARSLGPPRFVFVSAIVPNIEEISAWLGGASENVVRSDYRPAIAEFGLLRISGAGSSSAISLVMHPQEKAPTQYAIVDFLQRRDFTFRNRSTGRSKTYPFGSIKARAIATARKALPMGGVAVFSTNKGGSQGCIGLAEELLNQLESQLGLPDPRTYVNIAETGRVVDYLTAEFGSDWIVTSALKGGAVVHHGDLPQETRELLEELLRRSFVQLAICTSTLAEGVNLPIRTLVLYSVQRLQADGSRQPLLSRDVKNLVGRAGRAGSNTKGLVICANEADWQYVSGVASGNEGEKVNGALRELMARLKNALAQGNVTLTNKTLERIPAVHQLIDGIDMTLIDLAAEEIGFSDLTQIAIGLADDTFASSQATEEESKVLLRKVFELRADRVGALRAAGRLDWVRSTGARMRLIESVENDLKARTDSWAEFEIPTDPELLRILLEWAWTQPELTPQLREAFGLERDASTDAAKATVSSVISSWIEGRRFSQIAVTASLEVDKLLAVHTRVVTFGLQTVIEQGIALLDKLVTSSNGVISAAVLEFPEHLRFGVPTRHGRTLAANGVRHRLAYVLLGDALQRSGAFAPTVDAVAAQARESLRVYEAGWRAALGELVYEHTVNDLAVT
jgi:helicase